MSFEVNLIFLINQFFLHDQKNQHKNLYILRTKGDFEMTLKAFFSIFKGLSTKQIAILFGRCEFDFRTVFLFVITKSFGFTKQIWWFQASS